MSLTAVTPSNHSRHFMRPWHFACAAAAIVAVLFYGSWLPFRLRDFSFHVGLQLFEAILQAGLPSQYSRQDVAVNLTAGLPLGFAILGSMLCRKRGVIRTSLAVVVTMLLSLGVSVCAELGQVWIDGRVPSTSDIAAQLTGAVVGIVAWLLAGPRLVVLADRFFTDRQRSTVIQSLFNLYAIGLLVYSLLPLDIVTSISELGQKLKNGEVELVPFTFPYPSDTALVMALLADAVLYIPIGFWAVCTFLPRDFRIRDGWSSATLALMYAIGVESLQLLVRGRFSSTTDVIAGMTGAMLGILIAQVAQRSSGRSNLAPRRSFLQNPGFWGITILAFSGLLAVIFWFPFEGMTNNGELIRSRLRLFADVPFRRLQESTPGVMLVFVIIRNFAWFVPLGVFCTGATVCAATTARVRRLLTIVAWVYLASISLGIELGQVLMPSRVADSTEVLIRIVGGTTGLILGRFLFRREPTLPVEIDSSPRLISYNENAAIR